MTLYYSRNAEKQLKKLNLLIQQKIIFEIDKFLRGERTDIKKVRGTSDEFRIRTGSFRIQLKKMGKDILITKIGKRENFYLVFV